MANEIQICNLALSRLGGFRIQSLDDATKEARECKLHYPIVRDAVLEAHDWDFARKRLVLALTTETFSGWEYAYQYPTDCLVIRKIYDPNKAEGSKIPFEVVSNAALDRRLILTNQAQAELIYTAKVTDVNMFSSGFVNALAFRLAADLAIPLRGKNDLQQSLANGFIAEMMQAQKNDANQSHTAPEAGSDFTRARA